MNRATTPKAALVLTSLTLLAILAPIKLQLQNANAAEPKATATSKLPSQLAAKPPEDDRKLFQGFPARAADPKNPMKSDSGWFIEWDITAPTNNPNDSSSPSSVLKIASAMYMYKSRTGEPRWITVAKDLRLGEIFVPYDTGSPRFQDIETQAFWLVKADEKFLGPSCVLPGKILMCPDPNLTGRVYREVHDDGLRWISDSSSEGHDVARRGEKMLIWAVFYGANYRYIMEYGFSDDGTITCRLGATARNFYNRRPDQGDTHLHVACWRFNPDLGDETKGQPGGPDSNVIRLARRLPESTAANNGKFKIAVEPFAPGADDSSREGSALWQPEEFTTLRIESTVRKNGSDDPRPVAYDLLPIRHGSVRYFPASFDFVNKDFWVTLTAPNQTSFSEVATYAKEQRPIDGKPVTIWHNSPVLHTARGEDFGPDGVSSDEGVALTAWASFVLRPRNLFDSTPLFKNNQPPGE